MPRKISKSDTLDKEQEARDKEWLATKKESGHFTVGTFVLLDGKRYEIVSRLDPALLLQDEAGFYKIVRPYALTR